MKVHPEGIWAEESLTWFWALCFRLLSKHDLSVEPAPSLVSEFVHDSGSETKPCLAAPAAVCSGQVHRAGWAEVPIAPCLFRAEMARRGEIPQICGHARKTWVQAADVSSGAAAIFIEHGAQEPTVWGFQPQVPEPGADTGETPDGNLNRH